MIMHRLTWWARSLATTATLLIAVTIIAIPCALAQAPAASGPGKPETATEPAKSVPAKAVPADATQTATAPAASPDAARQARLVADTARLYKLAQELKIEVDKSSKDTMSLAVIKKAAEVEELARDLKERLRSGTPKTK